MPSISLSDKNISDWVFVVASISHSLGFNSLKDISFVGQCDNSMFSNFADEIFLFVLRMRYLD